MARFYSSEPESAQEVLPGLGFIHIEGFNPCPVQGHVLPAQGCIDLCISKPISIYWDAEAKVCLEQCTYTDVTLRVAAVSMLPLHPNGQLCDCQHRDVGNTNRQTSAQIKTLP